MIKKIYIFIGILTYATLLKSQNIQPCFSDEMMNAYSEKHPEILEFENLFITQRLQKNKQYSSNFINGVNRIIPVVFHVIHNDGEENISKEQIQDQIRILNEDYQRLNADTINTNSTFKSVAANTEIEFRLATLDPNGNCTDGIVRVRSSLTENADDNVKALSWWDNTKYLNIWVVKSIDNYGSSGIILGYAYLPYYAMFDPYNDGIIVRADYLGTIGTANASDMGRTLTHEVGHYLGLNHTFEGGCYGSGDDVSDTPPVADANYGCPSGTNSCSTDFPDVVDQIENYMDYSNGNCMNMFTKGQKSIFDYTFTVYRSNLISASNLQITGVEDGVIPVLCAPESDFSTDKKMICEGEDIKFTDVSWNGKPDSWLWTFAGGNPASSTDSAPTVTYNVAGNYAVTLQLSNASGSDTYTRNNLILVSSLNAKYENAFQDDFETASQFTSDWSVFDNDGGHKWERKSGTAYSGTYYLKMNNYGNNSGQVDEIVGPSVDIADVCNPKLTFYLAHAQKSSSSNDALKVYMSADCGETWNLRYSKSGAALASLSTTKSSSFAPSSQSDWKQETISIPSSLTSSNLLFKFNFTSDGGNNLYIDDINLEGTSDVNTIEKLFFDIQISSTPLTDVATIAVHLNKVSNLSISLFDVIGNQVLNLVSVNQVNGKQIFSLNRNNIGASGIYILKVNIDSISRTYKIAVN